MKYKLIVTYRDSKIEYFKRFLESMKNQNANYILICVYQGDDLYENQRNLINSYINESFVLLMSPLCSLSKARNTGLTYIYDNYMVENDDLIVFPDDDCWYEKDFLETVSRLDWKNNDFYTFRVFDPYQGKVFGKRPRNVEINLNYINSFRLPISVGLIIKLSKFKQYVNFFNELLGVGAPIGSGEETEVVLKLLYGEQVGKYNGFYDVYHEVYSVDEAFILKYEKYALGQGYCIKSFAKRFSLLIWVVFVELLARSFAGYLISSGNTALMYKIRFKSILKGAFYDKSYFR